MTSSQAALFHYAPSSTSTISSAISPCASRWTASALGASNRQKTSPFSSLNQYLRISAPYLPWVSRSLWCAPATASVVSPSMFLWWSMYSGIVPSLQFRAPYWSTLIQFINSPKPTLCHRNLLLAGCFSWDARLYELLRFLDLGAPPRPFSHAASSGASSLRKLLNALAVLLLTAHRGTPVRKEDARARRGNLRSYRRMKDVSPSDMSLLFTRPYLPE